LPGNEIGSYTIQRPIADGGEGILFVAYDRRDRKRVALKFPREPSAENIGRLRHEVAMGHEVHHPHVCKSERVAEEAGFTFGIMEYVEGENLRSILRRRRGPLPRAMAERVAAELCAGVSAMHVRELVHRDLKPENVMIDDHGSVKIIDLGVAEFENRGLGEYFGTPEYMAREQIEGRALKRTVDVFAIGVLLYEIFTGQRWLQRDPTIEAAAHLSPLQRLAAQTQVILRQQTIPPPPPSDVNPGLDFNVDSLVMPCLAIDPGARPKADFLRDQWAELVRP